MRVTWRRLREGEEDAERTWGVWIGTALLAAWGVAYLLPVKWVFPCALYMATGLPCPTCGTFRAGAHLLHGESSRAFAMQPLASLIIVAWGLYVVYAWIVVVGRFPRVRVEGMTRRHAAGVALLATAAVLANWLYLFVTLP